MDNLSKEAELALGPELAREIDSFIWSHKVTGNAEVRAVRLVKQLVDIAALAQHPATTDNWIRVENGLPEPMPDEYFGIDEDTDEEDARDWRCTSDLLICHTVQTPMNEPYQAVSMGRYYPFGDRWFLEEGDRVTATHWQPLPTPPTQATRKEGSHE